MVQRSNISYIKETHAIEPSDDPRLGSEAQGKPKTITNLAKERQRGQQKSKAAEHAQVNDLNYKFKN